MRTTTRKSDSKGNNSPGKKAGLYFLHHKTPEAPSLVFPHSPVPGDHTGIGGPVKLKEFPGFHDETIKGNRLGQRSSRLNLQYRVMYVIEEEIITVYVLEITPHEY
jgi:hypothetical protein